MEYEAVIGLETHVQLKTKSKMWCGCANEFGAPPNTNVCPVCLGLPGVLPVANEEAMRLTVLTGLLLHCEIPRFAKFDRKNYFYPDVAKNYQVTQYDQPSTKNGCVDFELNGGIARVRITRAHLEEDVAKNFHFDRQSGVDFNRAGVPLLEIVSEPEITSADMAYEYLNALKDILIHGGISDCDMEKGMVRCDVNVSVRTKGATELGAKIEIKNMNSFSGARQALLYEIPRQIAVVSKGGKLIQSTRRWDDVAGITEEMRTKEHAHDYRYFAEPDLMPFQPTDAWLAEVKQRLVELPLERKQRYVREYGLASTDAQYLSQSVEAGKLFEHYCKFVSHSITEEGRRKEYKLIANSIINPIASQFNALGYTSPKAEISDKPDGRSGYSGYDASSQRKFLLLPNDGLAVLAHAVAESRTVSMSAIPAIIQEMGTDLRRTPEQIVNDDKYRQVSDSGAIEKFCDEVIAANPGPAADFKAGKVAALNFLKGQVMKLSKGKANPALIGEVLEKKLRA